MISIIRYCFNKITKAPTRILIMESNLEKKTKRVGGISIKEHNAKPMLPVNDNRTTESKSLTVFVSCIALTSS